MNDSRATVKVGLFVLVGLVLTTALMVQFSKSGALFTSTYHITMVTRNIAGLKDGASITMAGVTVGNVESAELSEDGRTVKIRLRILTRYQIHRDARFTIDQSGFLGDQFVGIVPTENKEPMLKDGDEVPGQEPFNFQEIARSAAGLMQRIDQTVSKLNEAVTRVDTLLLSEATLTNLSGAISNLRTVSDRGISVVERVDRLIQTNAPAVDVAVSNLVAFSRELNEVSGEFQELIATNRLPVSVTLSNLQTATAQVNHILDGVERGDGLVGAMLKNPEMQQQASMLVSNLSVSSSNLNKFGLWRFLWKPKQH